MINMRDHKAVRKMWDRSAREGTRPAVVVKRSGTGTGEVQWLVNGVACVNGLDALQEIAACMESVEDADRRGLTAAVA